MSNRDRTTRWIGAAGAAMLCLQLPVTVLAAEPERPHGGTCSTVVTPISPPGVFPQELRIDSLRAEITLFEAARAHAVADARPVATADDVRKVAPLALRLRRSQFMDKYLRLQQSEERQLRDLTHGSRGSRRKAHSPS